MEGTAAAGRCRAKTGTITGVSALSGYCRSGRGRVAFSLLMNGVYSYEAARKIQDQMTMESLATGPDRDRSGPAPHPRLAPAAVGGRQLLGRFGAPTARLVGLEVLAAGE